MSGEPGAAPSREPRPQRALELYCGIGGFAAAIPGSWAVAAALDVSNLALGVYRANFDHPVRPLTLETVGRRVLAAAEADLWWLSPPCQPFTRRGRQRDDADPRSRSLLALLAHLEALRPPRMALENVPGFAGSRTHRRLRAALDQAGYRIQERLLCPTELGVPMRRQRFYLMASRDRMPAPPRIGTGPGQPIAAYLDPSCDLDPALIVPDDLARRYAGALDIADRERSDRPCACFTAAYGRSPVHSGSYLRRADGRLRRFHPREILGLLGFPAEFLLPPTLTLAQAWRLVGNSVSVDAVRATLGAFGCAPGRR